MTVISSATAELKKNGTSSHTSLLAGCLAKFPLKCFMPPNLGNFQLYASLHNIIIQWITDPSSWMPLATVKTNGTIIQCSLSTKSLQWKITNLRALSMEWNKEPDVVWRSRFTASSPLSCFIAKSPFFRRRDLCEARVNFEVSSYLADGHPPPPIDPTHLIDTKFTEPYYTKQV